jgi:hypothetical protein
MPIIKVSTSARKEKKKRNNWLQQSVPVVRQRSSTWRVIICKHAAVRERGTLWDDVSDRKGRIETLGKINLEALRLYFTLNNRIGRRHECAHEH